MASTTFPLIVRKLQLECWFRFQTMCFMQIIAFMEINGMQLALLGKVFFFSSVRNSHASIVVEVTCIE